jgi:hypothetical protein
MGTRAATFGEHIKMLMRRLIGKLMRKHLGKLTEKRFFPPT